MSTWGVLVSLSSQILPLVGVALGAVASLVVSGVNDRARGRREQAERWNERRLNTYAEYSHVVKELTHRYQRVAIARGLTTGLHPLEFTPEVSTELTSLEVRRAALAEGLWLFGETRTNTAAVRMTQCLWHLEWLARGELEADGRNWELAYKEFKNARQAYVQEVRTALGIEGPSTSPSEVWPPAWHPAARPGQAD